MAKSNDIKYFSRNSLPITAEQYEEYVKNESYPTVAQYDNGIIRVILRWVGRVTLASRYFPGEYPIFQLGIWNYDSGGDLQPDPASGKTFSYEDEAKKAYDQFLIEWTDSYKEGDKLVEVDNDLAPVVPDNDAPTTDLSELKGLTEDDAVW